MARWIVALALLTILLAGGVGAWQWQQGKNVVDELIEVGEVLTPEPLRGPLTHTSTTLTTAGVLTETNRHRATENLPALKPNTTLDQAAQKKVNDMFARQYFAHEAPDGTGPADLATAVHYEYIRIGENLALGNFASDTALVQAWMDSPGHRANIMHKGFSEIGLAVGKGMFEGSTVWLAVQEFGAPLSSCPKVDPTLQKKFDDLKTNLDQLNAKLQQEQIELTSQQADLEKQTKKIQDLVDEGQQKVTAGNAKIQQGNDVYEETGDRNQAQPYWDDGKKLQSEGQALLDQAKNEQQTYTDKASAFDQHSSAFNEEIAQQKTTGEEIQTVMTKLNQQIRTFNSCIK